MTSSPPDRPWLRRSLRISVGAAAAYACWILILNLALWTGLVSWLVSGDHRMSSIRMSHGPAWVVWPTTVHVQSFELSIDAYRYQLGLETGSGTIDVSLTELLQRRFHARSIEAQDVVAVFRYKAPAGEVSEQRRAMFGSIEGVADPVRDASAPALPSADKAWAVQLDAIDGQFSDLWVDELHFSTADVRVQGGLKSHSGSLFSVQDARVKASTAVLEVGGQPVADEWSGELAVDMAPYDPFVLSGRAVLGQLSISATLQAHVVDLSPVHALWDQPISVTDGEGSLGLDVFVREGVVGPRTAVEYRTDQLGVAVKGWSGRARVHASLLGAHDGQSALRAGVDLHNVRVRSKKAAGSKPIVAKHVSAFGVSNSSDLTKSLSLDDGHAIVSEAFIPTIAVFATLVSSVELAAGTVRGSYELDVREGDRLHHALEAELREVRVKLDDTQVGLSADLAVVAGSSRDLRQGSSDRFDVDLHDISVESPRGRSDRTWLKLHESSRVAWRGDGGVTAELRGRLQDLRIVLAHRAQSKAWVERVPDLNVTEPFDFIVDVRRTKRAGELRVRKLDRPGLRIEGIHRSTGDSSRSAFRLERLRLGLTLREDGEHRIHARANDDWMERQQAWVRDL